ncbi:MAG: biosynthetic-type acetolactate synthase large subunit [Verrucomicrobia bacterium]|nr:biosynthetic-type acetolactate synthase large subunit [Verrucomicrobiota bacterium]
MNGAELVIDCLQKEGVDVMFGFPGGSVLDIFDLLNKSEIKLVLVRHEQGAAHMADGYARSTGRVGVCIATSGPGATNLVTGIATAYMDSIPMVAITGQVPTPMIGNDAFQEADVTGITRPITKHNYLVKSTDELPAVIKEAFYIARSGRPGPVVIDIPKDVQKAKSSKRYPEKHEMPGYKPTVEGHVRQIKKMADAIKAAKRPIIYAGGGVLLSGAWDELRELVRKTGIPVTTTLMGLGAFDEADPLSLKMLGMHGTKYANLAVCEADLVIAIGSRFDDRVTGRLDQFAAHATFVHIDVDPSSISKNIEVHIPVVGDCKHVLAKLNEIVEPGDYAAWIEKVAEWKAKYPLKYQQDENGPIKPQYIIERICAAVNGNAVVTTDVGQHQMWAAQFFTHRYPRSFCSSGGLGTMGYGLPAAIGAQFGNPNKRVVCFAGDGSIQMNIQELATAVDHRLPIVVCILDNRYLGMVRQWQRLFYGRNYAHTCLVDTANRSGEPRIDPKSESAPPPYHPDFVKLADAYGAAGLRVDKLAGVQAAIDQALAETTRPTVIDFIVAPEEDVWPMVPSGAAIHEMIDESDYTLL